LRISARSERLGKAHVANEYRQLVRRFGDLAGRSLKAVGLEE
jgi:hypothetical protein